jgi:DNA-binding NarL/FixJ family response regulator
MSPDQLTIPVAEDHSLYRPGIDNAACRAGRLEVVAEAENEIGAMTAAHTSPAGCGLDRPQHAWAGQDRAVPRPTCTAPAPGTKQAAAHNTDERKVFGFMTSSRNPGIEGVS